MHHLSSLIISFLIIIFPTIGSAQTEFTNDQIRQFKIIYEQSIKAHPSAITEKEFLEIKNRIHLNNAEIKTATLKNKQGDQLSEKEQSFISAIENLKASKLQAKLLFTKALCKQYQLKEEEYEAMLKLYQSSIIFQNQVCKQV